MINLGKTFILGDSYSTFAGYIPDKYAAYYSTCGSGGTDVDNVEQTWWHQLLSETQATLVKNCSYSGTTICNTGYDGSDCSKISFIARIDQLIETDYFNDKKVDTFFIFGGTNDSWANAPIGEIMYSNWDKEDLYSVLPAFCYLLDRVSKNLPDTNVYCIINTDLKSDITEGFTKVCEKYKTDVIRLKDIDKINRHPSIKGMTQIKNQIFEFICQERRVHKQ